MFIHFSQVHKHFITRFDKLESAPEVNTGENVDEQCQPLHSPCDVPLCLLERVSHTFTI